MDPHQYQHFTTRLVENLASKESVLGVVALGSMAREDYQPDTWSDHDFFVIVRPGTQDSFKSDLSWLPDASGIVLGFRETEHGMKVVYESGHLLEFAIFDWNELGSARVNRYRVLFGPEALVERLEERRSASRAWADEMRSNDGKRLGEFLCLLLVGAGRAARGEELSGHQFIKGWALGHLLTLLSKHIPAGAAPLLDNLDPYRRFEQVHPSLGEELNTILSRRPVEAAVALLDLAGRELGARIPGYPVAAAEAIRRRLEEGRAISR